MTSQAEVDRLVDYMQHCVRSGSVTEWEREFCASIISHNRRGTLRPSDKQIAVMQRIVSKFQNDTMRQDEDPTDLIDFEERF